MMRFALLALASVTTSRAALADTVPMSRLDGPVGTRFLATRTVRDLGTAWLYADYLLVLGAGGDWWLAPPLHVGGDQGMGGAFTEADILATRLRVVAIGLHRGVALEVDATLRRCKGRGAGHDPDVPVPTKCDAGSPLFVFEVCGATANGPSCVIREREAMPGCRIALDEQATIVERCSAGEPADNCTIDPAGTRTCIERIDWPP